MSCKKEKNKDSKERDQVKLKNQKNSDSIRKEISEEISEFFKNIHIGEFSCSNRLSIHRRGVLNENLIDYSLGQENICDSSLPNISKGNDIPHQNQWS